MRLRRRIAALMTVSLLSVPGFGLASGPSGMEPWYLDPYGGDPADVGAMYEGRLGVVMETAPRSMLFIDWRLLHRRPVGRVAGDALSSPCCGTPWWAADYNAGVNGWQRARALVTGQTDSSYLSTERPGDDGTSAPNCFPDAFDKAAATLRDRAARFGAASPALKAWLQAQDAVFRACHAPDATLPPPMVGAPVWLAKDRDYQQAAIALYLGRDLEAADRFRAIAQDAGSPWRGAGRYLAARALIRQALVKGTPDAYARAHDAVATLAQAPPGAMGRDDAPALQDVISYRQAPSAFLATLQRRLDAPFLSPDAAVSFRDYVGLGETASQKPDPLDWIDTLRAVSAKESFDSNQPDGVESTASVVARYEAVRTAALRHAAERWRSGHDSAWLLAALSLADADDGVTPGLLKECATVGRDQPGWLSIQHHLLRLTLGRATASESRARIDAVLDRPLSTSDRNVFAAQRAQTAANLQDFVRFALRRRLCKGADLIEWSAKRPPACVRQRWGNDTVQPSGVYDGYQTNGSIGFGEDARAIIDRMPLAIRLAVAQDADLPQALRMDVALTNFARAVQLQDNGAINSSSRAMIVLLPLMAEQFQAVERARTSPQKRFAEFLVLAMIPGVRTDLVDYIRPEGRRVIDYQDHWTDWLILRRPDARLAPPGLSNYQIAGSGVARYATGAWPDTMTDLTCLGECGRGSAPLRLPDFIRDRRAQAASERGWFFKTDHDYGQPPPQAPSGAVDAWDEMLAFATAHRSDPRIPEALHWLVHVGHFGGSHNRSGYRAFRLLHLRYPGSAWAKDTPYYND